MDRMRRRLYPETLESLGYYWLKTVFAGGYERDEWVALDRLLAEAEDAADAPCERMIQDIRTRIRRAGLRTREAVRTDTTAEEKPRTSLGSNALLPYFLRLLNEWAPVEVARLLVRDAEGSGSEERGIPAIAFAKALERLIVRERLSPATLEPLLQPGLFHPRYVYPADIEVLRDVVLYFLGRTEAPELEILPATLLYVAPQSHLPADYGDEVGRAFLGDEAERDEVHVPISSAEALEALKGEKVRITSIIVTMDGRWWQADRLKGGPGNAVVYRPMGRLFMDYSQDHVRVRVPWPEARMHWSGSVSFAAPFEIFGRAWHIAQWEQDAEHTWLDLEFAGLLPIAQVVPDAEPVLRRSRPAFVDMSWTALENALATATAAGTRDAVEQMRREELIPLGRALYTLCEAALDRRLRKPETLESRLRAIAFHSADIEPTYGKIPWRVIPEAVTKILLRPRLQPALADSLAQVFEAAPPRAGKQPAAKAAQTGEHAQAHSG